MSGGRHDAAGLQYVPASATLALPPSLPWYGKRLACLLKGASGHIGNLEKGSTFNLPEILIASFYEASRLLADRRKRDAYVIDNRTPGEARYLVDLPLRTDGALKAQ